MKVMLLITFAFSSTLFAADEAPRYTTKTRVLSESIIKLSKCLPATSSSYDGSTYANVRNRETGEYSYESVPTTFISANTSYEVVKCKNIETYTVGITGSYFKWNRVESEVPGSAKASSIITSETVTVKEDTSLVNYNELNSNAIMQLSDAVKIKAENRCVNELKSLNQLKVDISRTGCK